MYSYILTCRLIFHLTSSSFVGTLEGFSFDSEDDVDDLSKATLPTNQNGDAEEQPNGKNKQRSQKPSVCCLAVYLLFLFHICILLSLWTIYESNLVLLMMVWIQAGKKVKIAGGKPAKKVRKKPQAPRKGKSKK